VYCRDIFYYFILFYLSIYFILFYFIFISGVGLCACNRLCAPTHKALVSFLPTLIACIVVVSSLSSTPGGWRQNRAYLLSLPTTASLYATNVFVLFCS